MSEAEGLCVENILKPFEKYNFDMEEFDNIEDFVKGMAEELLTGSRVYYDLDKLRYSAVFIDWIHEYGEYIDLEDDEFEKVAKDSHDDMIDLVREIRDAIMLSDNIEAPFSSVTFRWREDFVEVHRDNARFLPRAVRALSGKHPFRSFKMAVYDHDLKKEWFAFELDRMKEYVRHELGIN